MVEYTMSYEEAYAELEEISRQIENESISVDLLSEKVKRASDLLLFCQEKLRKTELEVNQIIQRLNPVGDKEN